MLRSDLALEAKEMYEENSQELSAIEGVKATSVEKDRLMITTVEVLDEKGSKALNKPEGKYITIEIPDMDGRLDDDFEDICSCLKENLLSLTGGRKNIGVMVAGVGNRDITSDSVGPLCTDSLIITRHLMKKFGDKFRDLFTDLWAVKTQVAAKTGMESGEICKAVANETYPDAVIVVDALVSRSSSRVGKTIQITDTGIVPGSGVGNFRQEISSKTLDIPVIAIGVPTVISASAIAFDAIELLEDKGIVSVKENKNSVFESIREELEKNSGQMMVCPKDSDELSKKFAKIIAYGINLAFHNVEFKDIASYID